MTTGREADLAAYARAGILLAEEVDSAPAGDCDDSTALFSIAAARDRYFAALPARALAEVPPGYET